MDAEEIIRAILEHVPSRRNNAIQHDGAVAACKEFLENCDYYVVEGDDELRELALKNTNLVEP